MVNDIWRVIDILPSFSTDLSVDNWVLYALSALVLGIIIGGMMKGLAKLVLGIVMFLGFVILALLVMQKQDILSMIASIVFGIIMLVSSFLVKLGKTFPFPKR